MAIFISYSHQDKIFAEKLAQELVLARANVWIDKWEINVGDSFLNKIQSAVAGASAVVFVLSKASVESEWCKKELTASLLRELNEKRVIVLPALLETCTVPLFLQDKLYADFRGDFGTGLDKLLEAVSSVTADAQGRAIGSNFYHDWSIGWGTVGPYRFMELVAVTVPTTEKHSFLCQMRIVGNDAASARFEKFEAAGFDWFCRHAWIENVATLSVAKNLRFFIENTLPLSANFGIRDKSSPQSWSVEITVRRMGEDNGKAQIYDVLELLHCTIAHFKSTTRKPSSAEISVLMNLIRS